MEAIDHSLKRNTPKFILGTLAGVTIGLLLAPKSGDELREDLSRER